MQLICKLLSCYCKQVWYFIGNCSSINKFQCENNNGSGLPTWAIIVIIIVLAGILLAGIVLAGIIAIRRYKKKNEDKNEQEEEQEEEQKEEQEEEAQL